MISGAFEWLLFNFFWIVILAFYSMGEMACVSLNKIRLQYNVTEGSRTAQWLDYLLRNPSRLFGTTLIGVNVATFASSECARRFHEALGINPDWTPLSQVLLVLMFGELAPIFAARHYAEHLAYLSSPVLYFSSKIFAPAIWVFGQLSRYFNQLVGGQERNPNLFLSEDELQKILEEQEEDKTWAGEKSDFSFLASNLLKIRSQEAHAVMSPLNLSQLIDSNSTVGEVRQMINEDITEIALYLRQMTNIVGMVTVRDLIRAYDNDRIQDYAKAPWFVTEKTKVIQILKQFRINNENVGIVLNEKGQACGILSMDDVIAEIFGKPMETAARQDDEQITVVIDRSLPGETTLEAFNKEFNGKLEGPENQTLSEYLIKMIGHHPEEGETLYVHPFEFTIKEAELLKIALVRVRTRTS